MAKSPQMPRGARAVAWLGCLILLASDQSALVPLLPDPLPMTNAAVPSADTPIALQNQRPALGLENSSPANAADIAAEKRIRELFNSGQFSQALQIVGSQQTSDELSAAYKQWLDRQIPVLKLGWGWQMIREKDCISAIPLLEEATLLGPQPLANKGIGYCYLQAKDWWAASGYLERYLETKPTDPEAYILLADAKESQGDYDEALSLTQKAKELQTLTEDESKDLERRESSMSVRAKEGFDQGEMQVGYFLLRYQIPDHQNLVQGALDQLQATVQVLAQNLGVSYPPEGIEVVFHRAENFQGATHSPAWAGGIYDGRIRIPVAKGQEMDEGFAKILRHEVTHALLSEHSLRNKLPTWFQEGLAQVAECPQLCWRYPATKSLAGFLGPERLGASFLQLNHSEAQLAYRQSFYMMQVMHAKYGDQGVKKLIEELPNLKDFSSDSILQTLNTNFMELHDEARDAWQAQKGF